MLNSNRLLAIDVDHGVRTLGYRRIEHVPGSFGQGIAIRAGCGRLGHRASLEHCWLAAHMTGICFPRKSFLEADGRTGWPFGKIRCMC